jgi:nitric oxide reductase activation protein
MQSEGSGDEGESSHSAQATINRKLGFAFVLDNGNDIETVHETHTTHVMLEENKKQGSKEATEKQKQRDVDYSAVMEKINKENQEFSEKTQKTEQVQKNEASAEQNKKSEASAAEQHKRVKILLLKKPKRVKLLLNKKKRVTLLRSKPKRAKLLLPNKNKRKQIKMPLIKNMVLFSLLLFTPHKEMWC